MQRIRRWWQRKRDPWQGIPRVTREDVMMARIRPPELMWDDDLV